MAPSFRSASFPRSVSLAVLATLFVFGCLAFVSAQDATPEANAMSDEVAISFEQTPDQVVFDFAIDNGSFERVNYNTSVRDGETIVKVVFESESQQKFVRLHLASAILPSDTSATTTEEGAKIILSKANPG